MLDTWKRWMLFLSSYFPLYILIGVKGILWSPGEEHGYSGYVAKKIMSSLPFYLVLGVLLTAALATFIYIVLARPNTRVQVDPGQPISNDTADVLSYFMTYLLPILSMDITSISSVVVNIVIFLIIGLMYVRGEIVHLNPLLVLFGYSLYTTDGFTLISNLNARGMRRAIAQSGGDLHVRLLAQNVAVLNRGTQARQGKHTAAGAEQPERA